VGPTGQGGGVAVTARVPRARGAGGGGRAGPGGWRGAHDRKGEGGKAGWAGRKGEGAAGPKWEERGGREKKKIFLFL
jgi:hypothetical protein